MKKIQRMLKKTLPIWFVLMILMNSSLAVGIIQYYIMKKNFTRSLSELSQKTKTPEELVQILKQEVLPQKGYILGAEWRSIGKQLIESGAIDKAKYEELFVNDPIAKKHMWHLMNSSRDHMVINEESAHFMVNTLWALGLVNKSKILEEGSMKTYGKGDVMSFASTGGWTLGSKPTNALYSSAQIIVLTPEQEELVQKMAQNIYRPCCSNHTEFPDCNHGMAVLGYIQLAVQQGLSEKQMYKDVLALNSFWFPQSYVELAAHMKNKGIEWDTIDARSALSSEYSSAQGAQRVQQAVQNIPGFSKQTGGCGA